MQNRYFQKIQTVYDDQVSDVFLDIEYRRTEPDYKSIDIKEVKIHRAYIDDDSKSYVARISDDKCAQYGLEKGSFELIRSGLIEVDLDAETEMRFKEAFIESVIHDKMCEAILSFQMLHGDEASQWILPEADLL